MRNGFTGVVNTLNLMTQSDGMKVTSARDWRVNGTTRYSFRHGWLKSAFIGSSVRWQSANVVGYRLQSIPNAFPFPGVADTIRTSDVTQPIFGKPLTSIDAFFGYATKLLRGKVRWRVQLNIRNLFDDDTAILQQVYSDGSSRQIGIPDPRLFILTNTFSF